MRNDSSGNDPRTIWQNQPTEPCKMTLVMIRHKTQQLQEKTRRELFGQNAALLFLVGWSERTVRCHGCSTSRSVRPSGVRGGGSW